MARGSLALVIELHHPMPGPDEPWAAGWGATAARLYWPLIRSVAERADAGLSDGLTLAVSPSWTALAADPAARGTTLAELDRRADDAGRTDAGRWHALRQFVVDRWAGDPLAALRRLAESRAVELIPATSSHAWLPAAVDGPVMARAQVALAVRDHASTFAAAPHGIWLPHRAYRPDLEQAIGESGARYFAVDAESFRRGTVRPPHDLLGPLVTRPGVAAFGVDPDPTAATLPPGPHESPEAARERGRRFVADWRAAVAARAPESDVWPISVAALSAHDLDRGSHAADVWLDGVLVALDEASPWRPTTPGRYLERHPEGPLGRPGPSVGGWMTVRPGGTDLLDRLLNAGPLLPAILEAPAAREGLGRRAAAQAVRSLLLAQGLDWSLPEGYASGVEGGLSRAAARLDQFAELAWSVLTGRIDPVRLASLEAGPAYLPDLDLGLLSAP
jgi:1,4-alpha-glucan branching enzyme